jgi:hypothetical protein
LARASEDATLNVRMGGALNLLRGVLLELLRRVARGCGEGIISGGLNPQGSIVIKPHTQVERCISLLDTHMSPLC